MSVCFRKVNMAVAIKDMEKSGLYAKMENDGWYEGKRFYMGDVKCVVIYHWWSSVGSWREVESAKGKVSLAGNRREGIGDKKKIGERPSPRCWKGDGDAGRIVETGPYVKVVEVSAARGPVYHKTSAIHQRRWHCCLAPAICLVTEIGRRVCTPHLPW